MLQVGHRASLKASKQCLNSSDTDHKRKATSVAFLSTQLSLKVRSLASGCLTDYQGTRHEWKLPARRGELLPRYQTFQLRVSPRCSCSVPGVLCHLSIRAGLKYRTSPSSPLSCCSSPLSANLCSHSFCLVTDPPSVLLPRPLSCCPIVWACAFPSDFVLCPSC